VPADPERLRFFVDESALGLGKALERARDDVVCAGHPLVPEVSLGTEDTAWMPAVSARGRPVDSVTSAICSRISSWNTPSAGQLLCRSRVSISSGNHERTRTTHEASSNGCPPARIPAAIAGAVYLRTVLRSTPKLAAMSACERPACQCTKISVTSITSNVLLATWSPSVADVR